MCLTAFLYGSDHAEYIRKSWLTEDKSKCHENKKGFMRTEINFVLGKNGGNIPSSLGGKSIVVVRQAAY